LIGVIEPTTPRLRRSATLPIIGAVIGAGAGFAYYWFFGCDSG